MSSKTVPAKSKPTTATEDTTYKVIATATTTSLSGACDLKYQLGLSDSGDLGARIHSSSGTGLYSRQWISLDEAWQCLTDWEHGPVTALALFPMYRNQSVNTPAYVTAVLLDIGLLTPSQEKPRHFDLIDDDRFAATVADLKATHSTPRKAKPKVKAKAATRMPTGKAKPATGK
jgi:hypothetical protein